MNTEHDIDYDFLCNSIYDGYYDEDITFKGWSY